MTMITKMYAKYHDRKSRMLNRDEEGLSLLAYALGAAVIVAPLAILLLSMGESAITSAETKIASAIAAT